MDLHTYFDESMKYITSAPMLRAKTKTTWKRREKRHHLKADQWGAYFFILWPMWPQLRNMVPAAFWCLPGNPIPSLSNTGSLPCSGQQPRCRPPGVRTDPGSVRHRVLTWPRRLRVQLLCNWSQHTSVGHKQVKIGSTLCNFGPQENAGTGISFYNSVTDGKFTYHKIHHLKRTIPLMTLNKFTKLCSHPCNLVSEQLNILILPERSLMPINSYFPSLPQP